MKAGWTIGSFEAPVKIIILSYNKRLFPSLIYIVQRLCKFIWHLTQLTGWDSSLYDIFIINRVLKLSIGQQEKDRKSIFTLFIGTSWKTRCPAFRCRRDWISFHSLASNCCHFMLCENCCDSCTQSRSEAQCASSWGWWQSPYSFVFLNT